LAFGSIISSIIWFYEHLAFAYVYNNPYNLLFDGEVFMKNVLFPGKFQPPHLGHIITIMRLRKDYNKIIIGITDDKPEVIPQ